MKLVSRRIVALSMGAFLVLSGVIGMIHPQVAHAASTFTVDSTLDTGDANPGDNNCDDGAGNCTLRAAIEESNANANPSEQDTISFGLSGVPDFTNSGQDGYTFTPAAAYADITEPVIIDGYSQLGAQANTANYPDPLNGRLLIQLDGSQLLSSAFAIAGDNVRIAGLIMNNLNTPGQAFIKINSGTNAQVSGNYIGTDPTGMTSETNYIGIITLGGDNTKIGSSTAADRNIISGNTVGIDILGPLATVQGNYIGPDVTGAVTALSSAQTPIVILNSGAHDNLIGGISTQDGNTIAGNATGSLVYGSTVNGYPINNAFLGNSIFGNAQTGGVLGIDLALDANSDFQPDSNFGSNTNDPADVDSGANDGLNTPVIHSAVYDPSTGRAYVHFDLDVAGSPSDRYRVEFFANDTSAPGQGKSFIYAFSDVAAGLDQVYDAELSNVGDPTGKYITATVTQQDGSFGNQGFGSTSEFSQPIPVASGQFDLDVTKTLTNPNEIHVGGTADYNLTITNNGQVPAVLNTNNYGFAFYDVSAPGLSYDSATGDDLAGCQVVPDQDAQQFLAQGVAHHTNYHMLYCESGTDRVMVPGESTTVTLHFKVESIPTDGFANYAMLFSEYDPDFLAIADIAENVTPGTLDIFDLYESGALGSNGNVSVARYSPTSESKLAASGEQLSLTPILSFVVILPAAVAATRNRRKINFRNNH